MKKTKKLLSWLLMATLLFTGCSKNDDASQEDKGGGFGTVDIYIKLPEGSNIDLTNTKVFSLSTVSDVNVEGLGKLPFNNGSYELGYLLDEDDNLLMAGFLSDKRKEISITTTAEVMLYYGLGYYLLPNNAKKPYLEAVQQSQGFNNFVNTIAQLFKDNPLMYTEGTYLDALDANINTISSKTSGRIFTKDERTKSGVTIQDVDASSVLFQNALPRRAKVFVYKKSFRDKIGNINNIDNYTASPLKVFDLEPGKTSELEAFKVGNRISQINAQSAMIQNTTESDPVELPVGSNEYFAGYEIVILGSGDLSGASRALTKGEKAAYEDLTKGTYILDYFLPTLLDIGGNKGLLPVPGDAKEQALINAVLPILEANPEVLAAVKTNDFKTATELFLPELYGDVRLSNDLRNILEAVYNTLSNNGNSPNTFVQSQELVKSGHPRLQKVLSVIYKNMDLKNKANISLLRTEAKAMEDWFIQSIDADVSISNDIAELCLGQSTEIRVGVATEYEPDFEEVEFHWKTSNEFKGRIQDINNNPSNFGASIITKTNVVSYISTALESELGSGNNIETVEVVIYMKNKKTGVLSEVGRDSMTINNRICISFFVGFVKEVEIREFQSLICNNGLTYSMGHPQFVATFLPVENAKSYKGKIKRKDGTFGNEFAFDESINDSGSVEYKLGVGSISIYETCNRSQAEDEQKRRLDYLDEVGHQGIEVTPVF